MKCTVKGQRVLASLETAFSEYEKQLEKLHSETESLRKELENTKEIVVSVAHEFGMSSNDSQFCNALSFVKRNLSQFQTAQKKAEGMGYSSLNNLFKAVKMTTAETRNKKNRSYFEKVLPGELLSLPFNLRVIRDLRGEKKVEKFLVESLYPTLEEYLSSECSDLNKLLDKWDEMETVECLIELKNWCVERMFNIHEKHPSDKILLENLAEDSVALSDYSNETIRRELADWASETGLSVTRAEYEAFWEDCSYDRVVKKLLSRYAGCSISPYAIQALKDENYILLNGSWREDLSLGRLSAAMQAVEEMTDKAEWNTDFIDAAREAISKYGVETKETSSLIQP